MCSSGLCSGDFSPYLEEFAPSITDFAGVSPKVNLINNAHWYAVQRATSEEIARNLEKYLKTSSGKATLRKRIFQHRRGDMSEVRPANFSPKYLVNRFGLLNCNHISLYRFKGFS